MMASKKRINPGVYNESTSDNYNTFDNIIKQRIITEIKQKLIEKKVLQPHEEEMRSDDLTKRLGLKQNRNIYNQILKDILPIYISSFDLSTRNLREWRRRLKGWMESFEKEESRGSPLIPVEKLEAFKHSVIEILPELPSKDIDQLRVYICNIAKQMEIEVKDAKKSFSRNWWYLFLKKHPEIRAIWDQVPIASASVTPKGVLNQEKIEIFQDFENDKDFFEPRLRTNSDVVKDEFQTDLFGSQIDHFSSPKLANKCYSNENNTIKIKNTGFEDIDQFISYNTNEEAPKSIRKLHSGENQDRVYMTRDHSVLSKSFEKQTSLEWGPQTPRYQSNDTHFTDFFNFFGVYQQDSKTKTFPPNPFKDKTDQI